MEQPTTPSTAPAAQPTPAGPYRRNYFVALVLSLVVGYLGVDRFYMGKIGTGILKLITAGGLGVWYIIDIVLIASGQMRDKDGRLMTRKFDLPD